MSKLFIIYEFIRILGILPINNDITIYIEFCNVSLIFNVILRLGSALWML